jgi:hypothetical protein
MNKENTSSTCYQGFQSSEEHFSVFLCSRAISNDKEFYWNQGIHINSNTFDWMKGSEESHLQNNASTATMKHSRDNTRKKMPLSLPSEKTEKSVK